MRIKIITFAFLVFGLTACTVDRPLPETPQADNASIKLAEAAHSVSNSMSELARIQREASPPEKGYRLPEPEKLGIRQTATVDWSGPVQPLLIKVAKAINYRFRVLGTQPAVPVIITLSTKNAPVASILRDIDFQANHKAHVVVYSNTKVIELRYAKA